MKNRLALPWSVLSIEIHLFHVSNLFCYYIFFTRESNFSVILEEVFSFLLKNPLRHPFLPLIQNKSNLYFV